MTKLCRFTTFVITWSILIIGVNLLVYFLWEIPDRANTCAEKCIKINCTNEIWYNSQHIQLFYLFPSNNMTISLADVYEDADHTCSEYPNLSDCFYKKNNPHDSATMGIYKPLSTFFYIIYTIFMIGCCSMFICMNYRVTPFTRILYERNRLYSL